MSCVAYKTSCEEWNPLRIDGFFERRDVPGPQDQPNERTFGLATRQEQVPKWARMDVVTDTIHGLYWCSGIVTPQCCTSTRLPTVRWTRSPRKICGENVKRILVRTSSASCTAADRLIISNLGLKHRQGRGISFSMYAGIDVSARLGGSPFTREDPQQHLRHGLYGGMTETRGCSIKGKFWARDSVDDLMAGSRGAGP